MKILVANIGSTSFKWRFYAFEGEEERLLHRGALERVSDYGEAIDICLAQLREARVLERAEDLDAVGFKVVLGLRVTGCVLLTEEVLRDMEEAYDLAPAHNPPYVAGIRKFAEKLPGVPLVGLFETAFYQWIPEWAKWYAVPWNWRENGVRRWGFHGASHKYIAERSAEWLGRPDVANRVRNLYIQGPDQPVQDPPLRVISCHLGGSSSVTGLLNGVAIGNSMGLTPQSGLPQNNRVGDLDVFSLALVTKRLGLSLEEAFRQLWKEAGLKGVSGVSNDIRDIRAAAEQGNERARLALDLLVHECRRWIGAYLVELGGIDALVFTAGIGENNPEIRSAICAGLQEFGIELDEEKNAQAIRTEAEISRSDRPVKVLVLPTNEELIVAREAKRLVEQQK